jgi:hypothetical protein
MIYRFHKIPVLNTVDCSRQDSHPFARAHPSRQILGPKKIYPNLQQAHPRPNAGVASTPHNHTTHNGPENPTRTLRQEARSLLQHSRRTRTVRLRLFCNHRSEYRKSANTSIALNRRLHAYAKRTNDSTNAMLITQSEQRVTPAL